MVTMVVSYPGDAATRFDRAYYVSVHVPLVLAAWGPHGLTSCTAFFPAGEGGSTVAIAVCEFRDEAALQAALRAPETPQVMADVQKFTDSRPSQFRTTPV